ncbi:MFS transporter [Candidatus Lucifugimonas marina]|uniref:MFS transporter n=1 Tax=Candidatus Lucifugimonas marina TaxID=3038979 RepID=A0AAJ5ZDI9_9CHLR|nr:MFS transporter [SAR202 cluster bacterium JH702]MDG0868673.1 MFS transporter [SAR202 cluster bacterium JH639]WFG35303.1 MFS transporter [SAR202 cluster bacterium JH545]WFG39253.1 MFS transporter [SAR202 cluster bacterium JH1073]
MKSNETESQSETSPVPPEETKPHHRQMKPWSSLQFRDYTLLWLSGMGMLVAMQLRLFTSTQWLYEETGSEVQLGILGAIQFLHMPVVVYGGLLADIINRKKLMVFTQGVSFISMLLLTLAAWNDVLSPWMIFVVTGATGIVNSLGNSARPAMLPRVIPRSHTTNGVTFQTASFQIGQIVAPLLFGVLFTQFGVTTTFLVGTVFAGISMIAPAMIRASGAPDPETVGQSKVAAIREGATFVRKHPILPGLYLLDIGVTVVSFYRMLFPLFASGLYGMGAEGTALLGSANAFGGVGGSMLVFFTEKIRHKGRIVLGATMVYAVGLIAFGLTPIFWIGLVIVALLGATDSVGMTMRQAIVQLTTPDRLIGRASSAHSFAAMSANNIGQMEVAFVSAAIGAGATMVLGGFVGIAVVGIIWIAVPGVRRYEYTDVPSGGAVDEDESIETKDLRNLK